MKLFSLLCTFLFCTPLIAQTDIVGTFADLNKKQKIVSDINDITQFTYNLYSMEEGAEPDTLFEYNGEKINLYCNAKEVTTYPKPTEMITKNFNGKGDLTFTITTKLHEDGRLISVNTDMGDSPAAALMNSFKEFHYDDEDRIVSVFSNGLEIISLEYGEGDYFNHVKMDAGMGLMDIEGEQDGKVTRYNMSIDMSALEDEEDGGFAKMFAEKLAEGPKEYFEMKKENDNYIFAGFKEDKESGKAAKQWENIRDKDQKLISEKTFDKNGEIISHYEYKYQESGEIMEKKNMLDNTTQINKFDKMGNLILEHDLFSISEHSYDKKGNLIRSILMTGDEEDANFSGLIVRKINYK